MLSLQDSSWLLSILKHPPWRLEDPDHFFLNLLIENYSESVIIALQRALGNVTRKVLRAHRQEEQHVQKMISRAASHLG